MEKLVITIPLAPPSLNVFYSGKHWSVRNKLAKEWHEAVWFFCKQQKIKKLTEFPLNVLTQSYYKSRRERDTDNTILAAKLICDGLKFAGVIPDDTTKYIGIHTIMPPITRQNKDMTIVVLSKEVKI